MLLLVRHLLLEAMHLLLVASFVLERSKPVGADSGKDKHKPSESLQSLQTPVPSGGALSTYEDERPGPVSLYDLYLMSWRDPARYDSV